MFAVFSFIFNTILDLSPAAYTTLEFLKLMIYNTSFDLLI